MWLFSSCGEGFYICIQGVVDFIDSNMVDIGVNRNFGGNSAGSVTYGHIMISDVIFVGGGSFCSGRRSSWSTWLMFVLLLFRPIDGNTIVNKVGAE
jgi:hypothetical protein